jgi:hypothetical protein
MEKYGGAAEATDDNIIRRMRFAYWITKATDTHTICNAYCFSTATTVSRTRGSFTIRTLSVFLFSVQRTSRCMNS